MMLKYDRAAGVPRPAVSVLEYSKIRELSSKDDEANGASVHVINVAASALCKGRFGNWPGSHHEPANVDQANPAVVRTIQEFPERFGQLHSGFVITASKAVVDDKVRTLTLNEAWITDGLKSLEAIRRHFSARGTLARDFSVRCTVLVDTKEGTHEWVRMTRNAHEPRDGAADFGSAALAALASELERRNGAASIFGTADGSVESVDRVLALQIMTAMMPERFLVSSGFLSGRSFAFYQPMECVALLESASQTNAAARSMAAEFRYFADMSVAAWLEYKNWKDRDFWVNKLPGHLAKSVPEFIDDAIIFPILAAKSEFVVEKNGHWVLDPPTLYKDEDLLLACMQGHSVFLRTTPASAEINYESLAMVTKMAKRYSEAKSK